MTPRQLPVPPRADVTSLDGLVSPLGLVKRVGELRHTCLPGGYRLWKAEGGRPVGAGPLDGGGRTWDDPELARFVALAEVAERYAGLDVLGEPRVDASYDELVRQPGIDCLEPWRYPVCTPEEYAHPRAQATPFDPAARIRWSCGYDPLTRRSVWLPSVMACYHMADLRPAERFAPRISTGYAVHTDPVEAAVRGLLECVERDANALTWQRRLPLPPVDPAALDTRTTDLVGWCRSRFLDARLFDATTDLGVPVAYCLLTAEHDRRAHRVVGSAADRTLAGAAGKALGEAMSAPTFVHHVAEDELPGAVADMATVGDTARYMARVEHAEAFDFLLDGLADRPPSSRAPLPDAPRAALDALLERLAEAGMRPVLVDRTTRELAEVGLTAVNAVVPDLQPMSLRPLATFGAHRRLSEAPRRMGYVTQAESGLNPWPQPMG
ncbi:YcaO-like family protein [Streptomyces sedi]|uniref:YcaO domain-containing protein n=1 Tax=Streptomyces sedi TaxID=555059 RepID=A0A5C4VA38_9ACTN|nr:YcaO-like family protein [Streptomyces sedi]TNM32672.1 hypothetical protein FH715_04880 [Streptomyces sedi]